MPPQTPTTIRFPASMLDPAFPHVTRSMAVYRMAGGHHAALERLVPIWRRAGRHEALVGGEGVFGKRQRAVAGLVNPITARLSCVGRIWAG